MRNHSGWLLLVMTLVLYLPGTGSIPLMDRDEPRFAHATVEMMQRGTWTVPFFNGEPRYDKPPLTYWWMRLHYHLFGVNELAARLHSVLAVYLTAIVISGFAGRLADDAGTGLFAAGAWLVSLQPLIHGRLCVADMPMLLCVTLACRAVVELLTADKEPKRWNGWFWWLWLSLAAGFLAKGPIAWLVPGVAVLLWRWAFWRKPLPWRRLQAGAGFCVALAAVSCWGLPALIETKGAFWSTGMGEHVVKRGTDVFNGRKFVPGYYLLTTWLSLFPWLGFAMPAWTALRTGWTAQRAFLLAWFLAPQVIFFFYATQLPHYVMPGYPGFLILLALVWNDRRQSGVAAVPSLARWLTIALGGLAVSVGIWCHTMDDLDNPGVRSLLDSAVVVLVVVLGLGGWAASLIWKNGFCRTSVAFATAVAVLASFCLTSLGDQLRKHSIPVQVAGRLRAISDKAELHGCGYTEPSLVFYTRHPWRFTNDLFQARQTLESRRRPVALVMLRREWTLDRWFKGILGHGQGNSPAKDHSAVVAETLRQTTGVRSEVIEGFNMARFSWVEVALMVHD